MEWPELNEESAGNEIIMPRAMPVKPQIGQRQGPGIVEWNWEAQIH